MPTQEEEIVVTPLKTSVAVETSQSESENPTQVSTDVRKGHSRGKKKVDNSSVDSSDMSGLDNLIPTSPSKPKRKSSSAINKDGEVKSVRKSIRKSSPKSTTRKSSAKKVSDSSSSSRKKSRTPSSLPPSLANEDSTTSVSFIPRESVSPNVESKPTTPVGLSTKSSSKQFKEVNHNVLKEVIQMTEQIKKSSAVEETSNPTPVESVEEKKEVSTTPTSDSTPVQGEVDKASPASEEKKDAKTEVKTDTKKDVGIDAKAEVKVNQKTGKSTRGKRGKRREKKVPTPQPAKSGNSTQVQSDKKVKGEKKPNPAPNQNQKQKGNQAKKRNRSRRPVPVPPKMSNARFSDKVFQNSSEALSRVLVRKEQKALLKNNLHGEVLDADVPLDPTQPSNVQVTHGKDAMTPTQTMKMPKVPPETRPGRAAMFGNVPMNPIHYEPRHKAEDYSRAYLREKVFIDSDSAQRLFESTYDEVNVSFSVLTSVLRRFDKSTFNKTEKQIISELTKIQQHFIYAIEEISKTIEQCVPEENRRVAYHDHEREYEVPIHTPYSLRFITCVALFDRYVSRLNAALITGLIDYDNLDSCTRTASDILRNFVRNTVMLRYRSIRDLTAKSGRKTEIKRAAQMAEKAAKEDKVTTSDPHPVAKRQNAKSENRK